MLVDGVHTLIWHNTKDGLKGKNPPKRVPRPGDKLDKDEKTFGKGQGRPLQDIDALLAEFGPGGDDVSQSKSVPRTSTSSRQRAASKRTSPKNLPQ